MICALPLVLLGRLSKQIVELCVDATGFITKIVFITLYRGAFFIQAGRSRRNRLYLGFAVLKCI
jgi:hypothetical protein